MTLVTPWTIVCQTPLSIGFPSKNTGVGWHFLLQKPRQIFNTHFQTSVPSLLWFLIENGLSFQIYLNITSSERLPELFQQILSCLVKAFRYFLFITQITKLFIYLSVYFPLPKLLHLWDKAWSYSYFGLSST